MLNKKEITEVFKKLNKSFPDPKAPLKHKTAYQLLVAVILSAQCTDERVNKITSTLFKVAPTPQKMIALGEKKLKKHIHSCGFFNSKTKSIMGTSKKILKEHNGKVPDALSQLIQLSGVAEKTASVVLSQWFHVPAFAVDTHVHRLSNRIGLCKTETADKTHQCIIKKIPQKYWINGSLQMVFHGRYVCTARKPKCKECVIRKICRFKDKNL